MDYIAIIISIIALLGAGFAFLRANSTHHILTKRIESLKEKNTYLEARVRKLEGNVGKGNRPAVAVNEPVSRNQPRQEQPQQEPRQRQRDRQPTQQIPQQQPQQQPRQEQPTRQEQPQQQKRKKENRRRNELMETNKYDEIGRQEEPRVTSAINLEVAGGDLLAELEQQAAGNTVVPQQVEPQIVDSGKRYAIIPEDGVIRLHQLQQRPDSDSYIEVDVPTDGSNMTGYRFNLSGNHAFVISQGIDRLENAFSFEKPSNRMVNKVVLQGDGVLTKVNNGWKIMEKARIDFR